MQLLPHKSVASVIPLLSRHTFTPSQLMQPPTYKRWSNSNYQTVTPLVTYTMHTYCITNNRSICFWVGIWRLPSSNHNIYFWEVIWQYILEMITDQNDMSISCSGQHLYFQWLALKGLGFLLDKVKTFHFHSLCTHMVQLSPIPHPQFLQLPFILHS